MIHEETFVVRDAVAGLVRVAGSDAFDYLQSQFSNDLRNPDTGSPATYGLWLTRKGRVAADSLVARLAPEEFLLLSFYTPSEALAAKVTENVIADDVESAPFAAVTHTVAGPDAAAFLASAGIPVPAPGAFARDGDLIVLASRRGGESYEIVETGGSSRIRETMTREEGLAALESLRVSRGVPRVPEDCGPGDLPQEAGLDEDAVCFTKGCFLGQEVMARLRSQGRATRMLTRLLLKEGVSAEPGAKLFSGDAEAGEVRSQANVGAGRVVMAMLRLRVAETAEHFSLSPGGESSLTRIPAS